MPRWMRGSLICIDLVPLFLSSVSLSFWFWLYDLPVQIMMPANNVMPFEGFCFSIPCMGNKNTVSNRPAVLSIYIYTSTIINLRQWIRKFEGYSYSCVSFTKWILFFIWVYLVRMEGSIQHIRTMLINQDDVLRIPLHGDMYSVYNLELFHVLVKQCYEMPSTWK